MSLAELAAIGITSLVAGPVVGFGLALLVVRPTKPGRHRASTKRETVN